jgi:hypothetical protein
MHCRIKLLIAAHLCANVASMVAAAQVPLEVTYLPAIWACLSVPMAQIMLLGFAVGMGSRRFRSGIVILLLGAVALAATAVLPSLMRYGANVASVEGTAAYVQALSGIPIYGIGIGLVALVFLSIRRWGASMWLFPPGQFPTQRRFQFTIFQILLFMSVAAVLLSCGRYLYFARTEVRRGADDSPVFFILLNVFVLSLFALNIVSAVWAALGQNRPLWRVAVVVLTSTALGAAMALVVSFVPQGPAWQRWLLTMMPLTMSLLPTLLILATLLVVRSCGYRLVPLRELKRMHETWPHESSAAGEKPA